MMDAITPTELMTEIEEHQPKFGLVRFLRISHLRVILSVLILRSHHKGTQPFAVGDQHMITPQFCSRIQVSAFPIRPGRTQRPKLVDLKPFHYTDSIHFAFYVLMISQPLCRPLIYACPTRLSAFLYVSLDLDLLNP